MANPRASQPLLISGVLATTLRDLKMAKPLEESDKHLHRIVRAGWLLKTLPKIIKKGCRANGTRGHIQSWDIRKNASSCYSDVDMLRWNSHRCTYYLCT
uniref:Uncharacterized protein n=1 Tax=Physcomitrium patens TaxID=3218 RepID=A0A2K1JV20_PHYPA|nr:hypothetical protein PHYPA_015149 [Physcomitrium patens]